MWDETLGKKGANEIASYLFSFISKKASEGKKVIVIWSDNCAAQNKNRFLISMYLILSAMFGIRIIHRYLIKGHTQNEADGMHARIENACRNEDIFVLEDWCKVMERAKVKGNPYIVNRIKQSDILDFHYLTDKLLSWPSNASWDEVAEVVVDHKKAP